MHKRTVQTLALAGLLTLSSPVLAQETPDPHRLPFASEGNTLELAVANTSAEAALENVTVHIEMAPEWLAFTTDETLLEAIASGEESTAAFLFDVNRNAPVGEAGEVVFRIESAEGVLSDGPD